MATENKYNENQLISITDGRARIRGLGINWTSASEINKTYTFGDEIIDAVSNQPARLPGRPTFDSLIITTPRTIFAVKKLDAWLKTKEAEPGAVSLTVTYGDIYYIFTGCTLSKIPISPAIDANANQTTASFLSLTIEVTHTSKVEIKETKITIPEEVPVIPA